MKFKPDTFRWLIIWIIMSIAGYATLEFYFPLNWPIQLLITTNFVTLVLVLIDKISASMRMRRIPEKVLFIATFFGGSIGMILGMMFFHHKTKKDSFYIIVALLVLIQIVIIIFSTNPALIFNSPLWVK